MPSFSLNFLTRVVFSISVLAVSVITARVFGPQLRGELAVYINLLGFLTVTAGFSFPDAIFHPRFPDRSKAGFRFMALLTFAQAPLVFIVLVIYSMYTKVNFTPYIVIVGFAVLIQIFDALIRSLATRDGRLDIHNKMSIACKLISVTAVYPVAIITRSPIVVLLTLVLPVLIGNIYYIYGLAIKRDVTFTASDFRSSYISALPIHSGLVGAAILSQGDQLILGYIKENYTLANYQIAAQFLAFSLIIPQALIAVIYSKLSYIESSNWRSQRRVIERLTIFVIIYSSCFIYFSWVLSKAIIRILFGDDYIAAAEYLKLLSINSFGMVMMTLMGPFWVRTGYVNLNSVFTLTIGIAFAISASVLTKIYGVSGLITASVSSYMLVFLFNLFFWQFKFREVHQ